MRTRAARAWAFAIALAVAKATYADPPHLEERALDSKRQDLVAEGRFEEAIPVNEQLVLHSEAHRGKDDPLTLLRVRYLAYLHRATGDWRRAEQLYQRAIEATKRTLGTGHVAYARSLEALGALYEEMGDHEHAEPIFKALVARAEGHGGPEGSEVPLALAALARLYVDMGAYDRAEPLFLRAIAVVSRSKEPARREVTMGPSDTREVESEARAYETTLLNALARLYWTTDRAARAEPLLRRALVLDEGSYGTESQSVAIDLANLALVRQEMGDPKEASSLFARAAALREKLSGPDHPSLAVLLHNVARFRLKQRDPAGAEQLAARALGIVERAKGPDHPKVAEALFALADAQRALGRTPEAVKTAERGAAIQDRDAAIVLAVGSEAQKRAFVATHKKATDALISLHARGAPAERAAARLALTTVLRRKGRVMDAVMDGLAALRAKLDDEGRALLDRLSRVSSRMAAAERREGSTPAVRAELARLDAQRRALEAEIAQKSADFRADRALVTIDEIERALPEGAALVEIVSYRPYHELGKGRWDPPRYAAYSLRRGKPVGFVDLGDAREIDAAAARLRRALADPDLTHDPRPAARDLYARVGKPVLALAGDARHVFLSPDGALSLVPFGALAGDDGRWLAERVEISYVASGRDLLRFGAVTKPREPALVVADPAFGTIETAREAPRRSADGVDLGRIAFAPLPGTAAEAREIGGRIAGARLLLGDRATEAAIRGVRGPAVLHVATHGFFLASEEEAKPSASLDLGGAERAAAQRSASPLLRSGIALAGANLPPRGREDGILTALEAGSLDLFGTRLVVLSACETGVGEVSSWEGVAGMRRALAVAGAETQVMSLWPVDSGATRELMTRYYQGLAEGRGRSDAMRAAQLSMIAEPRNSHPNLWAAFIVSGSPRALDGSEAGSFAKVAPGPRGCGCATAPRGGSGAALLALGLAIAARRRRRTKRRVVA